MLMKSFLAAMRDEARMVVNQSIAEFLYNFESEHFDNDPN
jgi:hypothetical protein